MSNKTSTLNRVLLLSTHLINHLTKVITFITHLLFATGVNHFSKNNNRNYFKPLTITYNKILSSLKNFDRYSQTIKLIGMSTKNSSDNKTQILWRIVAIIIRYQTPTGSYPWSSTTT